MSNDDDSVESRRVSDASIGTPKKARLIAEIPMQRVDMTAGDGSSRPAVGDIVELDHGFTGPNGESMGIVVCFNDDRSVRWVADIMDSEIELIPQ